MLGKSSSFFQMTVVYSCCMTLDEVLAHPSRISKCCFAQGSSCDGEGQASFRAHGRSTPIVSFLVRGSDTQLTY